VTYETVNTTDGFVRLGEQLLLSGFGCIYPGGSGGNDGVYRVGASYVQVVPQEGQGQMNIITNGGGALCYGDSGGPAFKYLNQQRRLVVAVNSMADMRSVSYLASTSTQASRDFFWNWSNATGSFICGVSENATNCR
jgi:hypothetical protein